MENHSDKNSIFIVNFDSFLLSKTIMERADLNAII